MPKSRRPKKKPPLEISDNESDIFTFSLTSPSPSLSRVGEKRGHPQSSSKQENQKPAKKTIKPMTFTAGIPSIPFPPLSLEQHL